MGAPFKGSRQLITMVGILVVAGILLFIIVLAGSSSQSAKLPNTYVKKTTKPARSRVSYEHVIHDNDTGTFFTCEVKGTSYRSSEAIERARILDIDEPLLLEREPSNHMDIYAIKVVTMDEYEIGYIPKEYSRILSDNMDAFVDCFVDRVVNSSLAPYIYIRVFFNRITAIHYMQLIQDQRKRQYYERKYQGFRDSNYSSKEDYLQKWDTYLKENPDDFFIKYYYIDALEKAGEWIKAEEYVLKIYKEYKISEWDRFNDRVVFISSMAEHMRRSILHDELILKHAEGKRLFERKEYEKALELFKECLPLKQQLVPRNICKCYEKLGMQEELYDFVIEILKEDWITVNNRVLIEKYIQ